MKRTEEEERIDLDNLCAVALDEDTTVTWTRDWGHNKVKRKAAGDWIFHIELALVFTEASDNARCLVRYQEILS